MPFEEHSVMTLKSYNLKNLYKFPDFRKKHMHPEKLDLKAFQVLKMFCHKLSENELQHLRQAVLYVVLNELQKPQYLCLYHLEQLYHHD